MNVITENFTFIKKEFTYKFIPTKLLNNKIIVKKYNNLLYILIKKINIKETYFIFNNKKKLLINNKTKLNITNNIAFFEIFIPTLNKNSSLKIKFVFINDKLSTFNSNKEKIKYLINTKNQKYIYNFLTNNIKKVSTYTDTLFNIDYSKINFVDKILWINMDDSIDRRNNMINIFKNIVIPNERILAIDGLNIFLNKIPELNFERNISKFEFACLLSHIKAISHLKNIKGNYFLICEDDFVLNNTILFSKDLKQIIQNCPPFDILSLQSTFKKELHNEYNKWIDYYVEDPLSFIGCTGSYIISKNGINKILANNSFIDENNYILKNPINAADIYLYKYVDTFVYKYNFIGSLNKESIFNKKFIRDYQKINFIQINKMLDDIDLL